MKQTIKKKSDTDINANHLLYTHNESKKKNSNTWISEEFTTDVGILLNSK